jgi:asparagine N-glycosylation enzyme membrane subunit Stt3
MMIKEALPQLIFMAIMMFSLGVELVEHGRPRKGKNNAFTALAGSALALFLLWWGGFFDVLFR